MSEKSDLLARTKPLADPVRIIALVASFNAILVLLSGAVMNVFLTGLGLSCVLWGLVLLIWPSGKPNAIYLRAFRTDKSTAELRAEIAAILGPDFRLSGIRPPRERTSVFMRFLLPGLVALRYAGSKFMELEAGDDWMARLWKTYQTSRLVLIDVRDMTAYVQQEIRMTVETMGTARCIFVIGPGKTEKEWRQSLKEIIGPASDPAEFQLLDVSPQRVSSRQMASDLKNILNRLPPGVAGEREPGRQFILDHVSEEALNSSGLSVTAKFLAVTAVLLSASLGALVGLMAHSPLLILVAVPSVAVLVLLVGGLFRAGARARRFARAGHSQAALRAWSIVALETLLFLAFPVLTIVQAVIALQPVINRANEIAAIATLHSLQTAEALYNLDHPDLGFACQISALEAAQIIDAKLSSGTFGNYTFVIANCKTTTLNGNKVNTGYQITAVPKVAGQKGARAFCTDESGEIHYDPDGGTNCTEPLR